MAFRDGGLDGTGDDFGGAGVRTMGAHDDGATGGEGARGVTSGDGEGEREIGSAEDGDGAEGTAHRAEVGLGSGSAVGQCRFDAGIDPRTFFDEVGEHAELAYSASALALAAAFGEAGFGHHARGDFVTEGVDFFGDGAEECRAGFGSGLGIGWGSVACEGDRLFEISSGGGVESGLQLLAGGGV